MSRHDGQLRAELLSLIEELPSTLKALDYLQVYAELRNQRAVADRRNTSASTVSETLTRLERAIDPSGGDSGRDLRHMIAAGEADGFMDAVANVLEACENLVSVAHDLRDHRTVLLGTFNSHVKGFVADAIQEFHKACPGCRVLLPRVMGGFRRVSFGDIKGDLDSGQSDYIIATVGDDLALAAGTTVSWSDLYEYHLLVVAEDSHPLMQASEVDGDRLVECCSHGGLGLLVGPEGYLSRDATRDIFRRRGRIPRILMENPDTNTRVALARRGYGIAVAHDDGIDPLHRSAYPRLVDAGVSTSGRVVVAWRDSGMLHPPAHEIFLDCLRTAAARAGDVRDVGSI